jgi:hypothetical protein
VKNNGNSKFQQADGVKNWLINWKTELYPIGWPLIRQRVLVLMLLLTLCATLVCQNFRLGFLNVRPVRTLAAFNITESIRTLCLGLTSYGKSASFCLKYDTLRQ